MKSIKALCPICNLPIDENELPKICPSCEAIYHKACWEKNKGCATFACPEGPKPTVARAGFVLCPQCGEEWPEGKKFCAKCGAKLEIKQQRVVPEGMVVCPQCGALCQAGKKFCTKCGSKLNSQDAANMQSDTTDPNICRNCGAPLKPGKKFCTKCGTAREE